ncbi:site-specific recombinase XerC [Frankia casuarinae]|jgi:integrase|uniref:Phage integrase n=1 Tax=Frankia casuarinae (strain DSM 45818 / CECT 9043 / HFP020203 / CcI3) TaxID=106370 RepID=Q2J7J8_FRACC|nr:MULTISPECIES: site-specific integrase [Frankia]ABD12744.1 phage integrase [Frankia casuarinae]ESZ99799.1 site-specific recombinase XerC [Frankia sp. CcI6]EYT89686.1 site-specific recombinase XerC [Frankia casuarinae]KEZ37045.1 site-specific recombinase XerC [Frankia sp. CeD]TFE24316.1 site-specific integrase [Frankia sp. B2]
MARPSLDLGVGGKIFYSATAKGSRARCFYRDHDGVRREVERGGTSKAAATRALKLALRDRLRVAVGDGDITPETTMKVLGEAWFAEQQKKDRSPNTLAAYRTTLDRHVYPALGGVKARQVTVGTADRFFSAVTTKSGPGAARIARTVLSGMCAMAARLDAMDRNVVRDAGQITRPEPKPVSKALGAAQLRQLRALLTYDERARRRDIPDLVDMLIATGARIGEVCGIVWDAVDLDAGTVEIRSTVVRITGQGLINKPRPKSKAGHRLLLLPAWAVAMLRTRHHGQNSDEVVFPAQMGGLRDPSNTQADIRDAVNDAGFPGLTSHLFGRRSVATLLDGDGHTPRQIADVLGHANPSITLSTYMGRKVSNPGAAETLAVLAI